MPEKASSIEITEENAIEILMLTNLRSTSELETFVINFIVDNGSQFLALCTRTRQCARIEKNLTSFS